MEACARSRLATQLRHIDIVGVGIMSRIPLRTPRAAHGTGRWLHSERGRITRRQLPTPRSAGETRHRCRNLRRRPCRTRKNARSLSSSRALPAANINCCEGRAPLRPSRISPPMTRELRGQIKLMDRLEDAASGLRSCLKESSAWYGAPSPHPPTKRGGPPPQTRCSM